MSVATILKAQLGYDTGQWLMSNYDKTMLSELAVLANCGIELTNLEILRVDDWYSTIRALSVSWLAMYMYLPYFLHTFTVCGAGDMCKLSVTKTILE